MAHYECQVCGEVHDPWEAKCPEGARYSPGREALIEAQMEGKPLPGPKVSAAPVLSAQEALPAATGANARQHGGNHYRVNDYQHWDWVYEMNLGYHVGNATKYVARWRKKNGRQDLEKAIHYLEKAMELDIAPSTYHISALNRFCSQLDNNDACIIMAIVQGSYEAAIMAIRWLLDNDCA